MKTLFPRGIKMTLFFLHNYMDLIKKDVRCASKGRYEAHSGQLGAGNIP
ncbi:hypothetical protein [Heyndrickxia vini]|uniref:Uncharacterized protein n=1 Tax=Heyndrickxia vini TaxID=1476025 RepID=A0ABX7E1V7_9BACI|nr:hypothetical protein [Heyndrickxia vini]QQZ09315.1 hypothetical protein I5776_20530 [Heyndrickxia vini]